MKKIMLMLLVLTLLFFAVGCADGDEEEVLNGENNGQETVGEEEEEEESLEGLEYVIRAIEEEFTVVAEEPTPYDHLGAVSGVELRIGRDNILFYEFDTEKGEAASESIEEAKDQGRVVVSGNSLSAAYNENRRVMIMDFENHPQGMEIQEFFEGL